MVDPNVYAQLAQTGADILGNASAKSEWFYHNNQQFQERMASTQHQREVNDLKLAGLNPILSAGGPGAAAPSGGPAPNVLTSPVGDGRISTAHYSAKQSQLAEKQLGLVEAQIASAKADARLKDSSAGKVNAETQVILPQIPKQQTQGSIWDIGRWAINSAKNVGKKMDKYVEKTPQLWVHKPYKFVKKAVKNNAKT